MPPGRPLLEKREKGRTPSYFSVSILEIGGSKLTGRRSRPPAVTAMFSLILSLRGLWSLQRGQPR
jgi:hypothetical protein